MTSKWFYIAIASMYVSFSVAVIAGIYITKSAWCLWAFLLLPSIKRTNDGEEEDDEI